MHTVRYHNRATDGRIFTEAIFNGERYRATVEMGFIELPDTEMGRDYAKSLCLEPMEGEPTMGVAIADPRVIEQHNAAIAEYERLLEHKEEDIIALRSRVSALQKSVADITAERDRALDDKTRLLKNYDGALQRIDIPKATTASAGAKR